MDFSKYQVKDNLKTVDKFVSDILNKKFILIKKFIKKEVKLLLSKYTKK